MAKGLVEKLLTKTSSALGASTTQFARHGNALGPIVNGRYRKYADRCHQSGQPGRSSTGVRKEGSVLIKSCLDGVAALELSDTVSSIIEQEHQECLSDTPPMMQRIANPVTRLGRSVIEIFNDPTLRTPIESYFGCHFRVQWLDCYRSYPTQTVSQSWLWHSDNVPSETLKVMLHLTGADKSRGATQFMTYDDTIEYYRAGYHGHTANRVDDLEAFAGSHGLPYRPFCHEAAPGDVMLFNNNALHKAVPPKDVHRDVLTYLLLPNPIPWDQQLQRDGIASIEDNPGGYPVRPWLSQAA